MELKIYDKSGVLKLTASPNSSSALSEEVMGECSVSASFTHTSFVLLDAGDYIELLGVRYKMRSPYRPVQKNTQTYSYTAKFYAPIHDAEDTLMLYLEDGDTRTEFSFDGGPREHLQLWVDNMNRVAGAEVWSIGTVITGENKTIDYNNLFCWEAGFGSNGIAAAYNTELWADGYVVNLCKAERGERVELGYLKGLAGLSQEENGDVKFFTRLFPLGSTRNIDATKYGHARLQLPSGAAYVDRNTALYGVKEAWEEASFSGIYPKYIGTVTSVRSEEKTSEEGRKYTVYYIKDSGMGFNPKDYEIPDLTYMLAFQTGDLAGRGGGDDGSFEVAWHEDAREWEIINVYPDDKTQIPGGEIVPVVGDTYIPWNFALPQEYVTAAEQAYAEAVDDYLSTYSFDPKKYSGTTDRNYIEQNRTPLMLGQNVRLLSDEYFADGYKDTRIVKCVRKLDDLCQATITCTDQIGNGWKTSVENQLGNLQYILAKQAQQVIIDLIKTGEGKTPSDTNVFSALRSLATFLRKDQEDTAQEVITFLKGLRIAGHYISKVILSPEELEEADDAIMSVLKAVNTFIRKDKADATNFLLKLVGGAEFGNYEAGKSGGKVDAQGTAELLSLLVRGLVTASGIESADFSTGALGTGFTLKIDENGDSYIEVDRMLVRKVATFVELLIQKIRAVGGQIILSPATMNCSRVEEHDTFYRCFFENTDGEKTIAQEFVVGDQARCQTFNVKEGVNENVTNTYYWRLVVGVGDDYIDLSKTDCDAGSTVPQAGDDIVQLGNRTDATRQAAIVLAAYGNDAPYFKMYRGIDSYSLSGKEFISFSRTEVMIIADSLRFSTGESVKDYIDNATGNAITSVDVEYALGDSPTEAPQTGWSTTAPEWQAGKYMWQRTKTTTPKGSSYSEPTCIQGAKGDQGIPGTNGADGKTYYLHIAYANSADGSQEFSTTDSTNKLYIGQYTDTTQDDSPDHKKYSWTKIKGDTGKGVSALEEQYYLSTSNTTQTGGTWQTTCPAWESGKYIWTRTKVTWTDNTVTYTTPVLAEDINDLGAKLEQAISDLAENIDFVNSLSEELGTVKDQVDGAIETWFYDPVPTLTNAPASSWTTTELKNQHLGDLYYDGNGKVYRFQMSGSNYVWQVITDTDITKALANAQKAQDTADGKRRVFVTTPTNASAYDVGDLWVNATYGSYSNDLLRCKTAKAAGAAWNISHWEKASKYTDDSKANQAIADAAEAMAAANNAQSTATAAKNRLDGWAADNVISPTEKQGLKDEIARIDGDKSEITANYTKYGLGTPTAYNNAHSAYRAVLVTLSAATPETIAIPSDFATKQTAYYTARTDALTAIADAAKAYVDSIEIGGRNLLMRTNQGTVNWSLIVSEQGHTQMTAWGEGVEFNVSSVFSGYAIVFYKLGETLSMLEPNTEYMLSFDVWCDISVGITVGIKNRNATGSLSNVAQFNTIANQTVHVAIKLTTKDLTEYLRSQGLYFDGFNAYVATYRFKNLKMEKGNKATGWTPAPEDAENALNDYKEEVEAKFEATNGSITAAVKSSKSYTDEKGEIILSQTTSMINVAKDGINLSVDTKIDNLVIGGRNLLRYSALEKTPLNNMVYGRKPENAPVGVEEGYKGAKAVKLVFTTPGKMSVNEVMWRTWEERQAYNRVEPVVLRFWAKADKDNTRMWTVLGYHGGKIARLTISSEWKEYTVNFMPDGPWALWCIGLDAPGTVWISRPKLEYGTKPTDWTPAPEDVDNSITELSSRIEVTEESIKNTVSKTEFNSLSRTVSNHTSQITQLNNQITSKVSSSELTEKLKGYVTTTTYNNKMSSIDQSLSSITSRVSSTETEINTIDGSLQSITQRVTTAEQKITDDAIKLTVKEQTKQIADEAVKDLELGGRNILLNTKVIGEANTNRINGQLQLKATIQSETYRGFSVCMAKGSTTKYTEILQYLITEFELGDIFTYSFYTKGTAKTLSVYFYGEHGYVRAKAIASSDGKAAGTSFGDGRRDIAVTGEWRRVWVTYQLNSSGDTSIPKCLLIRNQPNSGGDIYVCAPKLEKGSKATDWTPAPEDYSTTSEIKSSFTMTSSGISLLGQNISLTGKVTFSMLASDVQGDLNKLDGLGDLAYKDKVSDAMLDETVIVGGYLKTSLIDVDNLYVKHLEGADGVFTGSLQAATGSFSGEVTAKSGKIGGWRISEHDLHSEDFVYPDFTQPSEGNGGGLVSGGNGSMMRTDGIIINSTENGVLPASSGSIMAALINASGDNAWVQGAYIGAHCSSTYGYLSQVVALELSATNAYSGTPMNTPIALKIANGFPDIPGVLLAGYVYSSGISSKYKYGKKRTTSGAYQSTYGYGGVKQYQIIHNLGHSNYVVLVTPVSIGASWRKYHAHIVSQGPSDFFVAFIDSGTEGTLVQSDFMFAMIGNNT